MKSKEVKQEEADVRQAVHESLTDKQKVAKLNYGKFRASKERTRLGFPEIPEKCDK